MTSILVARACDRVRGHNNVDHCRTVIGVLEEMISSRRLHKTSKGANDNTAVASLESKVER
jgi:hypothetical protein